MTILSILLAMLLPWSVGALVVWLMLPRSLCTAIRACIAIGGGFVIGMGGWGVLLRWFGGEAPVSTLLARASPWLIGAILVLAGACVWRVRWARGLAVDPATTQSDASNSAQCPSPAGSNIYPSIPLVIALGILIACGLLITLQAIALPTLAWDAWNAWQAKSKSWYFADHLQPALQPLVWLTGEPDHGMSVIASHYPETLPRLVTWMASAAGRWDEGVVHLLWPALWLGLGLALFGHQRAAGVARVQATLVTTFLLTLPLVLAHVALAGYADLWVAAALLLAVAQGERWLRMRRWQDATLAILAAMLLPPFKLEGAIWLACLAATAVLAVLPRRWRWMALGAALVVWALSLPFGGLALPLPGLGWVRLGWGLVDVPGVGALALYWRPVTWPVLDALFLRQNWNLLWYLAPPLLWCCRRVLRADAALGALGWFFAFGFMFQAVLFFFTDASQWAENLTSLNRVLLQIVPAFVFWLSLLWARRPSPSDTPHQSAH